MSTRTLLSGLYTRFETLATTVRFGQFVSIGVLGAVCENIVLLSLVEMLAATPELAKLVGAEVSIIVMFVANERWTFATEGKTGTLWLGRRFLTSNLVRAGGVVVGTVVFSALIRWVEVSLLFAGIDFWLLAANAIGIGVGLVVNYVAESLFTWRVHTGTDGG
jgi:putative flippase GtrA